MSALKTRHWVVGVVLPIAVGVAAWLVGRTFLPHPEAPALPKRGNQEAGINAHGNTRETYLLPVPTVTGKERPDPEKFWANLLPAMAADPRTATLLQELFGGLRVQFVSQPAESLADLIVNATPPDGFDVILRAGGPVRLQHGSNQNQKEVSCLKVELLCAVVAPMSFFQDDRPRADDAILLALENHVLRQKAGWRFRARGRDADLDLASLLQEEPAPSGLQPDLDRRIKDYAAGYRAWLAAHPPMERRP